MQILDSMNQTSCQEIQSSALVSSPAIILRGERGVSSHPQELNKVHTETISLLLGACLIEAHQVGRLQGAGALRRR